MHRRRLIIIISAIIILSAVFVLLLSHYAARPVLVISAYEAPLISSSFSLNVKTAGEVREGEQAIWSPLAAPSYSGQGHCAVFGLDEQEASRLGFDVIFTDSEEAKWSPVFEACPEAVILYDSSSAQETRLAGLAPESMEKLSFDRYLNSVTEITMSESVAALGAETVIIFSPEKAASFLRNSDCTVVTDRLYSSAFDFGQTVVTTGHDFSAMAEILKSSQSGLVTESIYNIEK